MTAQDLLTTPVEWTRKYLGFEDQYDWQSRALIPLENARVGNRAVQISVLSPNEAGKSSRIVAPAALWWIYIHEKGKVVITTKDGKQLDNQIVPAIEKHISKFEGWRSVKSPYYKVTTPSGGRIIAYTTDSAANVEGAHSDGPDAPLLIIVDEAKSVAEDIFTGFDRCGYNALMYTSSGGPESGTFFNSQTQNRDQFVCINAGLKDCPHISPDKIQRIIDKYGPDAPFTISCLYGGFMKQENAEEFIFDLTVLQNCIDNPPQHRPGVKVGFCDFGGNSAEHVFVARDGNKAELQHAWRDGNKHAAASRFVYEFRNAKFQQNSSGNIFGDAADSQLIKLIWDLGWEISSKNFGSKARDDEQYQSWSAEAWHETALMVLKHEIIVPNDDILIAQLTSRKKTIVGRGKKGVEEKYDMAKRNVPSPDRADAFCGAFNVYDVTSIYTKGIDLSEFNDRFEATEQQEQMERIGAWAGS